MKCQNNQDVLNNRHRSQNQNKEKKILVSLWHIIFSVQIKSLEKSTMPTGTSSTRTGIIHRAKANPHKLKLLLLLPFLSGFVQNYFLIQKNSVLVPPLLFHFSAAVIAHLLLYSLFHLCSLLKSRTTESYISQSKMFTLQLTETNLSSLSLQLWKICCCACHFGEI